jgi:hypothetical protein
MIKIENIDVYGWEPAIRGMRNPLNSWEKSDSCECSIEEMEYSKCLTSCTESEIPEKCINCKGVYLGENDLQLMRKLSKAGNDHAKFLRMIVVTMDITAPQFWWAEADTYKIGTVRNSCSKMHRIHAKEFSHNDFSHEGIYEISYAKDVFINVRSVCERLRKDFNETGNKKYWRALIELLPEGYNMRATWQGNYQVLKNMYFARRSHRLDEWHTLCEEIEKLPYFKEICIEPME